MRLFLKADVVNDPIVKRSVIFELYRAKRVCNAFERILNRMSIVIQRINAPFISLSVMVGMNYSVDCGVSHIHIGRRHIYFCSKGLCAVGKFSVLHSFEKFEVLFYCTVAVGAVLTGLCQSASVLSHFIGRKVANIRFTVLYKLDGKFIALVKIIRAVENASRRNSAKPCKVLINGLNVFVILFCGICVIITKVEKSTVFFSGIAVYPYSLSRANVQISVRLRRKTCMNLKLGIFFQVFVNYVVNKI